MTFSTWQMTFIAATIIFVSVLGKQTLELISQFIDDVFR